MNLQERYSKEIGPKLKEMLGISNTMAVPRVLKVIVASGLNRAKTDDQTKETVVKTLTRITGQKPVITKARKSIAAFKIREGQEVGVMVTLRGKRMYDFLDRLVSYAFPRVRDFRGIATSIVDRNGNASVGFREHLGFPEIRIDEVERVHGLQVIIQTNAGTKERGLALFRAIGFPFKED